MNMKEIIIDLIDSGLTETQIADKIGGVTQSNINKIKKGVVKMPSYRIGSALIDLHKKVCKSRAKQ